MIDFGIGIYVKKLVYNKKLYIFFINFKIFWYWMICRFLKKRSYLEINKERFYRIIV